MTFWNGMPMATGVVALLAGSVACSSSPPPTTPSRTPVNATARSSTSAAPSISETSCPLRSDEAETPPGGLVEHARACDAGNAEACAAAGEDLRLRSSAPGRLERAVAYYQRACAAGSSSGCSDLARAFRSGLGVAVDYDEAKRLYALACDRGHAHACAGMGDMYEHQVPGARDPALAAKYYDKACQLGGATGCAGLGEMYQLGHGVAADADKALELYTVACRCQNSYGCLHGARLAEKLRREDAAHTLYRLALLVNQARCDAGDPFECSLLGDQYRDGKGVPRDLERAFELYTYGCENHMSAGCEGLESLLELTK
jgi:uncharacterized protein